jgi:hypothetical protein
MRQKIILGVVALFFLVFSSFSISAVSMPSTSPCRVMGSVDINGSSAPDGLAIEAIPSESSSKSTTTSDGNYDLNALGATDGETVSLHVCGILAGTFDFVPFCKTTDTEPWLVENIDLALQPNGQRNCTCDSVCSGGHCVNPGATGVCSSNTYYCDSDGTCESTFGETTSTCSADCHSTGGSGGGSSGGGSSGGGGVSCTYNKDYDWACSAWSACSGGKQTRTCKDTNNCGKATGRPATEQTCQEVANTNLINTNPIDTGANKALFDINAEIMAGSESDSGNLALKLSLINFGSSGPVDANLEYTISDSKGVIVRHYTKIIPITLQAEILDMINTTGLQAGKYTLNIKLTYAGQVAPANTEKVFYIGGTGLLDRIFGNNWKTPLIITVAIIALSSLLVFLFIKSRHSDDNTTDTADPYIERPFNPIHTEHTTHSRDGIDRYMAEEQPRQVEPVGAPLIPNRESKPPVRAARKHKAPEKAHKKR